ncbi:GNAT family N-acetyltransferase [Nocardioides sp.]|uniref:GNAT family N-acetyltransferase n=1 Tax=Nocardioides sp. TaxID=35761 RepID=UPI0035144B84
MIGFLHTAETHVATFEALLARQGGGPGRHAVCPDLLDAARAGGTDSEALAAAVTAAVEQLRAEVDVVVCTCSTIAALAEGASTSAVPVLRVDRPMAARAVALAGTGRIALVAALESTLAPTRALLEQEGAAGEIVELLVAGAWDAFEAGDHDAYADRIATAVRACAADVVVLAQASMAGAVPLLTDHPVPVLASPATAVAAALATPRLRPAVPEDVDAVLALWARAAENADRPADSADTVRALLARDPQALLVLEADGEVLGSVVAGWDGWRARLYRLAVAPEHRRRGHARRLVAAAEERLRRLGATRIEAMVLEDNDAGRAWWAAAGYTPQQGWRRWVRAVPEDARDRMGR